MPSTFAFATAALLATCALTCTASLTAQDVLISEVRADATERWIEVHNRGTTTVNLSTWTLFHASLTPGMPQTYWWGFPAGTTLGAGALLRVHWYQAAPSGGAAAGEIYTGATPFHFLFGLGGEHLHGQRGAIGLLSSQDSALMSSPNVFEDWVSWGQSGFSREQVAIAAGIWAQSTFAPSIPAGQSLARDLDAIAAAASPHLTWFVDATPTPLQPNATGASVTAYGTPCVLPGNHLLGAPTLRAPQQPLLGNAQFALVVDHTTGLFGEYVVMGFGTAAGLPGMPSVLPAFSGVGCHESIDTLNLLTTWVMPAQLLGTTAPLPLNGLPSSALGCELHVQAMVIDLLVGAYPPYQGITNAVRIVVGQ